MEKRPSERKDPSEFTNIHKKQNIVLSKKLLLEGQWLDLCSSVTCLMTDAWTRANIVPINVRILRDGGEADSILLKFD